MSEILILISDPALRANVEDSLRARGHTALASSLEDAFAVIEGVDVALVDVPAGLEAIEQLTACVSSRPVLAIAAQGSEDLAVRAFRAGASDYLTLPLGAADLSEAIARATAIRHRQRGSPEAAHEGPSFRERVAAFERTLLRNVLYATGGNQSETARRLRLTRASLYDKLKKHRLSMR